MPARLQAEAHPWLQLFRPAAGITVRVPDESPSRFDFGLDSLLLLSGLIWLAIGLGGMFAAWIIVSHPMVQRIPDAVPPSIALIGVPVALIGVAHLIVYGVRRRGSR